MEVADYLIVGGGTAGCALATRLKQRLPQASVTILEAGTDEHANPQITDMVGTFTMHYTEYEWKYRTAPQKNYDGRQVFIAGGKVLSGSSSVNYSFWSRGSKADYDLWAQTVGDKSWAYEAMLPYFKRTETHWNLQDIEKSQHGGSGPIHTAISSSRPRYPLGNEAITAFLKSTGLPWKIDGNTGDPVGVAPYTETWRRGKRQPAGFAYGLHGVNVITSVVVKRIIIENGTAIGAELDDGKIFKANKEVILSCGALRSPQILMLSGFGPKRDLDSFGIEQIVHNAAAEQVGLNMIDHSTVPMFYKVKHPENNVAVGSAGWTNPDYLLGMPVDMLMLSNHSNDEVKAALIRDGETDLSEANPFLRPDRGHIEIIPAWAALENPDVDLGLPVDGTVVTSGILCMLPTSRGSVKLVSTDPKENLLVDPNYFDSEVDRVILRQGMRLSIKAFETSPLAEQIEGHHPPPGFEKLTSQSSDAELDAHIKRTAASWHHPCGTCAMGKVVDSECKVIGVEKMRVVDASIFPVPLASHYMGPVYAIAEKMADVIVAQA